VGVFAIAFGQEPLIEPPRSRRRPMSRETVCRSMYSLMSKRTNSIPSALASCWRLGLADAGGSVKRNEPIGFSPLPQPRRDILMAAVSCVIACLARR